MREPQGDGWIGRPLKRREDHRLLTGAGAFVDDMTPPGCLHVALLRSPHAHARIAHLDVEPARQAPRTLLVVTGKDVAHLAPMPVARLVPDMRVPPHPILAESQVHAVGMPVAAVVAEDVYAAYDALDLIGVDYEALPGLAEPEAALAGGAPLLFSGIDGNRVLTRTLREGDAAGAFAAAAHVVPLRVAQTRISAVAMEPRSVLAVFDRFADELTMWVSCQAPFRIRGEVARLLELPESRVRVIAPDVGGGFGVKTGPYREDVLLAWLARELGRPVKWVATRREDQVTTNQARGSVCEGALALDAGGRITGLRATITSPLGSSLMNAAAGTPWNHARLLPGAYVVPSCDITVNGALTTTTPVAAYRGAGRPEACFFIERLMDSAARAIRLDPAELRRRNFIPKDAYPYQTPVALQYDSGDYFSTLDMAMKAADYAGFVQTNPKVDLGVVPFPAVDGGKPATVTGMQDTFSVNAKTAHPAEAIKFIQWLIAKEAAQMVVDSITLSNTVGIAPSNNPAMTQMIDASHSNDVRVWYEFPETGDVFAAVQQNAQALFLGQMTPEDFSAKLQAAVKPSAGK